MSTISTYNFEPLYSVKVQRCINLAAYLFMIYFNWTISHYGGNLIADNIPQIDQPSILKPSGLAFVLWVPIQLLVLIFTLYQLLPATFDIAFINQGISPFFPLQCLCNAFWLIVTHYTEVGTQYAYLRPLRLIFMYSLVASLVISYIRVNNRIKIDELNNAHDDKFYRHYFLARFWLSLYLAWIVFVAQVDTYAVLEIPRSFFTHFIASGDVLATAGLTLYLLKENSDAVFGFAMADCFFFLSLKNYPLRSGEDNKGTSFQVYLAASIASFVLTIASCIALKNNLIKLWNRNNDSFPSTQDENTPILAGQSA